MIADDSERFRAGIVRALERADGVRVLAAVDDGHQALARARALRPAVLVVDDRMPGLSGLDVVERITADSVLSGVAVVVLTANEDPELAARADRAGAAATVDKALSRREIVTAIRNAAR